MADYVCTRCLKPTDRDNLSVKKVVFLGVGHSAQTHRTRVTEWLCLDCRKVDPDYKAPAYKSSKERMDDARSRRKAPQLPSSEGLHGQVETRLAECNQHELHAVHIAIKAD